MRNVGALSLCFVTLLLEGVTGGVTSYSTRSAAAAAAMSGVGSAGQRPLAWSYRRYYYKPRPYRPLFVGKRDSLEKSSAPSCSSDLDCPSGQCCAPLEGQHVCMAPSPEASMCFTTVSRTNYGCGCQPGLLCLSPKGYGFGVCTSPTSLR